PEIISQSASQISPNDIRIEGDYAYVSDFYGFDVYDISEPEVPVLLGEYYHESTSTSSQRLCVRGNYVYVQRNHQLRGNYGADIWSRVLTVDVTDKASPAGVAAGPKAYKHYHDITRSGDTVFISSPSGFRALDVSTPAEPRVAGDFTVTLDDFALSGDYAFLAEGEAGMSVWDIPVVKNRLPHQKISTTGKGSAGRQRTARGDALWREQGSPVKVAVFDDVDDASGIAIKGDFAYLRDKLRLHVLDISNPAVPETVCQYTNESGITDHMISGTTLYLLSYGNLAILDISNPASPVLVGRSATYSGGRTLTVSGDFAYIMDSEEDSYGYFHNFLEVMDISDPSVPIRVSYLEINSCNSSRMFADGDYLYFANAKGLNIYDISNAPDYHLVSITPGRNALTTYNQYGVFIEDNYAYYSGDSGFNVLDISNPSAPFNVGGVDTGGPEGPIRKEGNTVYVGDGRSLLSIYRQFDTSTSVEISTAKKRFYFASTTGGKSTSARGFYLSSRGGGDGQWQASVDKDWLTCTPVSLDYGELSIDASGLEPGSYSGTVTITGPVIINSLKLEVVLNVIASQSSAEPFGLVATPEDGDVVSGSVPFNGWVLDDIEVVKVEIALVYGNAELLIGEAALVEGARPDVEAAYPGYPRGERAGWGYMQLTRGLPRGLDGNLMFRVYASDVEGHRTLLGTRTIIVNNSVAVAPFGAIDTPLRGGTAEDTAYSNYGWVLHRSPTRFP
ncbi:MAG: hypothetical protein GY765_07010, partial [bacterium]|nr:hypothetical protein [bacterium]